MIPRLCPCRGMLELRPDDVQVQCDRCYGYYPMSREAYASWRERLRKQPLAEPDPTPPEPKPETGGDDE
jgi:hypothetical protein